MLTKATSGGIVIWTEKSPTGCVEIVTQLQDNSRTFCGIVINNLICWIVFQKVYRNRDSSMRFYVCELKPEHATGETEFYDEDESRTGDAPKCELCGRHIGALTWLPPYRVELELWDSVFGDIAFGPGDNLLVSERFKTLWDERGLTGLQGFDPVEVVKAKRHKGNQPDLSEQPNYYCVSVARSQAAIDVAESGLEREDSELCPACRSGLQGGVLKRMKRIILEPDTWTGEDVFVARGLTGTYLVSERFKSFCDDYKITSATLIPAEEYSFDFYPEEREES